MYLAPGASRTTPGRSRPTPQSSPCRLALSEKQRPFRKMDRAQVSRVPEQQGRRHRGENPRAWSPPAPAFLPGPQSCRRLHGAQHIAEPAKVNARVSAYRCPRDLDHNRTSTVRNCSSRARLARRGHDRYEHWPGRGRKDQTASPRRFAPCKQMLRRHVVPSRHLRHNRARLIGLRYHQAFGLIAPPAPTANPGANINATASLRSVNYMVNHICEPIQSRSAKSSGSDRTAQDGDRAPLTLDQVIFPFEFQRPETDHASRWPGRALRAQAADEGRRGTTKDREASPADLRDGAH